MTESHTMDNKNSLQPVNVQFVQAGNEDDEISLFDLLQVISTRRYLVISVIAACTLAAVAYALTTKSLYQAEAYLRPPKKGDIVALNLYGGGYSIKDVYDEFISGFKSRTVRMQFFDEKNLVESFLTGNKNNLNSSSGKNRNRIFEYKFNRQLSISKSADKLDKPTRVARFIASSPDLSAQLLNRYIAFVNDNVVRSLKENEQKKIDIKIAELKIKIANLQDRAAREKEDKIKAIEEAIQVANRLGTGDTENPTSVIVNTADQPLYMKGKEVLVEELKVIRNREDLTPFIEGLRELESELHLVMAYKERILGDNGIRSVSIDQQAMVPLNRIKPNRRFIVLAGVTTGVVLAFFLVFVIAYIRKTGPEEDPGQ